MACAHRTTARDVQENMSLLPRRDAVRTDSADHYIEAESDLYEDPSPTRLKRVTRHGRTSGYVGLIRALSRGSPPRYNLSASSATPLVYQQELIDPRISGQNAAPKFFTRGQYPYAQAQHGRLIREAPAIPARGTPIWMVCPTPEPI